MSHLLDFTPPDPAEKDDVVELTLGHPEPFDLVLRQAELSMPKPHSPKRTRTLCWLIVLFTCLFVWTVLQPNFAFDVVLGKCYEWAAIHVAVHLLICLGFRNPKHP